MTSSVVVNVKKKRITELLKNDERIDGRGLQNTVTSRLNVA